MTCAMGQREDDEGSESVDRCQAATTYCYSEIHRNIADDVTNTSVPPDVHVGERGDTSDRRYADTGHSSDEDNEQSDGYLEPFLHQVGGHSSVLSWDQCTVCKPYSPREHKFYQILPPEFGEFVPEYRGVVEIGLVEQNGGLLLLNSNPVNMEVLEDSTKKDPGDIRLIRKCESASSLTKRRSVGRVNSKRSGSLELELFHHKLNKSNYCPLSNPIFALGEQFFNTALLDDQLNTVTSESRDVTTNSSCLYPQNPWALQCQTRQLTKMHRRIGEKQKFSMLENLVCNFELPCVLDLKMGYRQYGDDASPAKRDSQVKKCHDSTSSILAVRMCGMQVYHANSGVFKCYNKYYGRSLSVEGFKQEMFRFWHNGSTFRSDLLPSCIEKLKALKELICRAKGYRFYSSSLLIIYEGDPIQSKTAPMNSSHSLVDVRMIDFEHTTCPHFIRAYGDPAYDDIDKGYVEGIANLIDILLSLLVDQPAADNLTTPSQSTTGLTSIDQSLQRIKFTVDPSATSDFEIL